jgi:hypothetical protein
LGRHASATDERVTLYRRRVGDAGWLAIVHVPSQSRHRQNVAVVMTFASVSKRVPLQNGHMVGRKTAGVVRDSAMNSSTC